jgi:hypothetical protein
MPKSYYADNSMLNLLLRATPLTPPVTTYCALFTAAPNQSGGGTEVSGNGYLRQAIVWGSPTNGTSLNTNDVAFPIATADWGTITSFAVFDAIAGGNLLYYANLSSSRYIYLNDQVRFPIGQLICNET